MRCQLIQCPQCGQMNYATGDMCAVCSAMLPASEMEPISAVQARPKWLVGLMLTGLLALLGFGYRQQLSDESQVAAGVSSAPANPHRSTTKPQLKVPYKITETWTTPSGGMGQCILIESRYARPRWLRLLGQQLSADAPTARATRIEVFDNPQAAAIRAHRLYGGTEAEVALELKYHVAQYIRQNSPHRCALIAYFDGFGGVNQQTYRY